MIRYDMIILNGNIGKKTSNGVFRLKFPMVLHRGKHEHLLVSKGPLPSCISSVSLQNSMKPGVSLRDCSNLAGCRKISTPNTLEELWIGPTCPTQLSWPWDLTQRFGRQDSVTSWPLYFAVNLQQWHAKNHQTSSNKLLQMYDDDWKGLLVQPGNSPNINPWWYMPLRWKLEAAGGCLARKKFETSRDEV